MEITDWLIVIFSAVIISAIYQIIYTSHKKQAMEEKLASLDDFTPSQKVMGDNGDSGIAIDESRKKVCLIKQNAGEINLRIISYRDILSSEVFEDGITITKTARGGQLGGAIIGGLAFGGVGAIIGGLSAKKTSSNKIKRIDLRISVNNTSSPIHDISFMDIEAEKYGNIYNAAIEQARHWHGVLTTLIKQADFEETQKAIDMDKVNVTQLPPTPIADELAKLAELQKQGLLTPDEFNVQKAKLLAQ